ncbi:thermonuclease family protein [Persephonella sp. KM09-Lau-8]|uniref:thermonuclease family protein n=1 Tax=Persephonella sp. KM09-Lau-8 TaxID=1158345 RepID=UPI000690A317|nr:thermonuclease family protein [Persephonella sp. KM09-Lau-8]
MKKSRNLSKIFFVFFFFIFVGCKEGGALSSKVEAQVVKVIDGDTIIVKIPETTFNKNQATLKNLRFTVRLLGVDTPESKENRRARLQAKELNTTVRVIVFLGKKAKEFTEKQLLLGKKGKRKIYKKVYLEFDKQPQDRYGRLLAYVWLPDGKMLNRELICNGYALPLTIKPNTKYSREFLECYKKAVENHLGLWQRP